MKLGAKPRKIWNTPEDLKGRLSRLGSQINRLMILDHVWTKVIGDKARFWKLNAVKGKTLYVSVRLAVARNELVGSRDRLIKELNKYFERPWIEKIEIEKTLGASHE